MLWLSAALAFSTTMLLLSMITSVFVETIHRLLAIRVKGLRLMLGHFFDRVISSYYPETDPQEMGRLKSTFLDLMTVNRAPAGTAFKGDIARTTDAQSQDEGFWNWTWQGRRLAHLDVQGFLARLGSSEFGDQIQNTSGDAASDSTVKDIAQKFESFGNEASDFFSRRARLLSVIVAIAVAWGLYVNPQNLLATFLQNPDIASKVIELTESASQASVENSRKAVLAAEASGDAEAKAAADKAWRDAVDMANSRMDQLQQAGVPIGWNDQRRNDAGFVKTSVLGLLPVSVPAEWSNRSTATMLWLIVGGLLIGLGSPFWYDMVRGLTNLRVLANGSDRAAKNVEQQEAAADGDQFQTPAKHFWIAAAARGVLDASGQSRVADEQAVG